MTSLIGRQLGDYTLVGVLASGGMARVYEAVDRNLGRQAAVKVLELNPDDQRDEALPARFQREARAIAQLEHPNIITIYQYGEQDGLYFIAMKLIRGRDMGQELTRLRRDGLRMEPQRGLRILEQVASALDCAHAAHIIHRDVKPSNILLDANDRAILTDFGLVIKPTFDSTLGTAFGTPRYVAPEQALNSSSVVPQSDIYALGVILYEILTGQTPFTGETAMEIALHQINDPVPPPRTIDDHIPPEVEREILRALDKDPTKRQASAGELIAAVKRAYSLEGAPEGETPLYTLLPPQRALVPATSYVIPPRRRVPFGVILAAWIIAVVVIIMIAVVANRGATAPPATSVQSVAVLTIEPIVAPSIIPSTVQNVVAATVKPSAVQSVAAITTEPTAVPNLAVATAEATLPVVQNVTVVTAEPAGESNVLLSYTDTIFNLINLGSGAGVARDLDTRPLQFTRGEEGFEGSSIPRGIIPVGSCFRLHLQRTQSDLPDGCTRLLGETVLPTAQHFFWRSDTPATFSVSDNGTLITTCPTVPRGGSATCAFSAP